jgi:hypothetical protein
MRPSVVEERVGSDAWRPVFGFSRRQLKAMDARDSGCNSRPELLFGAVTVVGRPDGPHVVVGMGSQGVLVRSPAGGWERRPVLELRPLRTSGSPQLSFGLQLAALLALVVATLALTVWAIRRPAERRGAAAAIAAYYAAFPDEIDARLAAEERAPVQLRELVTRRDRLTG